MSNKYYVLHLRGRDGLRKGGRPMFEVIGGPFENEEDCIYALYELDEELRNVRGPNGKRTFTDEDVERFLKDTSFICI